MQSFHILCLLGAASAFAPLSRAPVASARGPSFATVCASAGAELDLTKAFDNVAREIALAAHHEQHGLCDLSPFLASEAGGELVHAITTQDTHFQGDCCLVTMS